MMSGLLLVLLLSVWVVDVFCRSKVSPVTENGVLLAKKGLKQVQPRKIRPESTHESDPLVSIEAANPIGTISSGMVQQSRH